MNSETKELWLKALRSGNYGQSKYHLHDENGYCCLGVLLDCYMQSPDNKMKWRKAEVGSIYWFDDSSWYCIAFLPNTRQFRQWTGDLSRKDQRILSRMNDAECKTFDQIANWIEKNL